MLTISNKISASHTAGLFVRRAVMSLVALCFAVGLAACKSELDTQLSESDANEIVDVLYANNIIATKNTTDQKSWAVAVDDDNMARAIRIMRESGLPREKFTSIGDAFKKEGMISTPSEERVRYVHALSQELEHTLSEIDGVRVARVHPVIPMNDPFSDTVKPSSVAVFIKHRPDANVQVLGPAIRNLVLRSIEGLREENISLTFIPAVAVGPPLPPMTKPAYGWEWVLIGVLSVLLAGACSRLVYLMLSKESQKKPVVVPLRGGAADEAQNRGGMAPTREEHGFWASLKARFGRRKDTPADAMPTMADDVRDVHSDDGGVQFARRADQQF